MAAAGRRSTGERLGVEYFAAVLWYLRTYLRLLLLSPLLLPLFRSSHGW